MFEINLKDLVNQINRSGSDKQTSHNYCFAYQRLLKKMPGDKINSFLEIGITNTEPENSSLHGWSHLFPSASIYGIDIVPQKIFAKDNIFTCRADQSSIPDLSRFMESIGYAKFDVILDDGSHIFNHALTSFEYLFKYLNKDGMYMIEDVSKRNDIFWQQQVSQWESYLSLRDDLAYEIIATMPDQPGDDSILIGLWRV